LKLEYKNSNLIHLEYDIYKGLKKPGLRKTYTLWLKMHDFAFFLDYL